MPISREKFYANRSLQEIQGEVVNFLKTRPHEAFEDKEIEKAIQAGPGEKKLLMFALLNLADKGVIDNKREIVKTDLPPLIVPLVQLESTK